MGDPFVVCPVLGAGALVLRPLVLEDAGDLLGCYGAPAARVLMNADNCLGGFDFDTLEEMRACILGWQEAYAARAFVRWAIGRRADGRAVGTVEMFGGEVGILRLDIAPEYETAEALGPLLAMATRAFHPMFDTPAIATKVVLEAVCRRAVLEGLGYVPLEGIGRPHYLVHRG